MAHTWKIRGSGILIHTLELKLWHFAICLYRKPCLPIKKITGARGTLTTLYQTLYIWVFGCLLASCGSTMHPARLFGGFWTIFFSA